MFKGVLAGAGGWDVTSCWKSSRGMACVQCHMGTQPCLSALPAFVCLSICVCVCPGVCVCLHSLHKKRK